MVGVAISINDHYELQASSVVLRPPSDRAVSEELLALFEQNFDRSIERSFAVCDGLMSGEA
jgi:hypothetical protein